MYHARDAFDFEIYNAHRDFGLAWYSPSWDLLESVTRTLSLAARERGHTLAAYLFPVHIQAKGMGGAMHEILHEQWLMGVLLLNIRLFE